jgi:hypothetical protein
MDFQLVTSYKPRGDQPRAIEELVQGLAAGEKPSFEYPGNEHSDTPNLAFTRELS